MESKVKTINASDLAKILDISEVSVHELVKKNIIQKEGRGQFIPHKCIVYYIRHLREQAAGRGGTELTDERARLAKAQAERVEMENEVTKGNLIKIEDAQKEISSAVIACRARILSIPTTIAPFVITCETVAEVKSVIENACYEALNELSTLQ